jgi:SAM-dependent methyltransferase
MTLRKHRQDWEELAEMDPCWAILADDRYKFGRWNLTEFFRTGGEEIQRVLDVAGRLGYPRQRERALDFGCGVGRLTRALARHFDHCLGVDISERMITRAGELNRDVPNCQFVVNDAEHLRIFADNQFDLVFTALVLQHIPGQARIKSYVAEFVRTLRPGGLLVFQLPSYMPPRVRLQPRRKLYALLRTLGVSQRYLHERLNLHPMRMSAIPEHEMTSFLGAIGATVLQVKADSGGGPMVQSRTYFATRRTE